MSRGSVVEGSSSNGRANQFARDFVCKHGEVPTIRTVKAGPNAGRKFFGCPKWPNNACSFFEWEDGVKLKVENQSEVAKKLEAKEMEVIELLSELKRKDEKILGLRMKKASLKQVIEEMKTEVSVMKVEVMKYSRGEKFAAIALVVSWIFFVALFIMK